MVIKFILKWLIRLINMRYEIVWPKIHENTTIENNQSAMTKLPLKCQLKSSIVGFVSSFRWSWANLS